MTSLPVVLVHGFMGGSRQWDLQHDYFRNRQQLIAPDLPGFGLNADHEAPDTIQGFAQYVLNELDQQGIGRFVLLGHSMGGMIVQEMKALEPDRIDRLILYGTASTGNLPNRFETFKASRNRILGDGVEPSARRISATWFLKEEDAETYEACAAIAECASLQAMLAGLTAMENWSGKENLSQIQCPTLIIWGEKDRTYGWEQINELWASIPNSSLAVMPGCAHAAHLEKSGLFNAILDDFLTGSSL